LSLFTIFSVLATANAETYTHTFKSGELTTAGGTVTLSDIEWNATDATLIEWNATKGIQIGSKNDPSPSYTMSTSGFAGYKIKSITVNSSIAASGDAKLTITVGNQTSEAYKLATSDAAYTFDCDDTNGDITISWAASQRAYYIKSITVEYELPTDMVDIEEPTFKVPAGVYENKVKVTTETNDQTLALYYTLDGTDPTCELSQDETGATVLQPTGTTMTSKTYAMYPELKESATVKVMATKLDGETVYKSDIVEARYIVSPTKPYVPAASITSGQRYAFVANDSVADLLFGAANGNLQGRKISGKEQKYIETVEYNAFTFTSADGGYTIQDSENRYMYLSGNDGKVSFAAEKPATGAVWSVSVENGEATIKNGNSTLYYSAAEDIFGCYADKAGDMVLPSVYMVREYPKAIITPEDGSYVQGLKEFTITCDEGIAVSNDFSLTIQGNQRQDRTYEIDRKYNCTQVDKNTLKFTTDEELVSVDNINIDLIITGDIILNPEGMSYKHPIKGRWTRSIYSYTHIGSAAAATITNVEPADGSKVEALSYILFTFSNIATTVDTSKEAKLHKEGSDEAIPFTFTSLKEDGTYTEQNQGGLLLDTPVTKNGTYILEIADGYFVDRNTKEMKGITLKYIVENETGIEEIIANGENGWVVYNINGIKVLETKDASKVSTLPSGIYIVNGVKTIIR
ncbi:MAG: chitobiase/beta-hexosaminidase C-terminal domain-containing protein, partial [Bacteroidaceae bacterium]|nr:chitobiase/beta-hexosaminidase C-terminal domain-containing protein [Bacteroidaceae bacterium]